MLTDIVAVTKAVIVSSLSTILTTLVAPETTHMLTIV